MRSPLRLGILVAAFAVTVIVFALGPCVRSSPQAPEGAQSALRDPRESSPTGDPTLRPTLMPTGDSAERTPAHADPVPTPEPTATPLPSARELALTLLERSSELALRGFAVRLRQGDVEILVQTDGAGRASARAPWKPGTVSLWHEPQPDHVDYEADWVLEPWQLDVPAGADSREAVVFAERPHLVLVVETVSVNGMALEGTEISLVWGWRDSAGRLHSEWVLPAHSDAAGRARLAVTEEQARTAWALLSAVDPQRGLASAHLTLGPPHARGPWRLVLEPVGSVRVEAFDAQGAPLAKGFARAVVAASVNAAMSASGARIQAGVGVLAGLGAGRYRVTVLDGTLGDQRQIEVDVAAGAETRVEVRFDDGATALAAQGLVLDADDEPLANVTVWMDVHGRPPAFCITDQKGEFSFRAAPTAELVIGTASDVQSDRFEPAELRVPFGSSGLVLRRVRELPLRPIAFEVRDRETGRAPVDGGGVFVWLGRPRAPGGWAWESLVEGRANLHVKAHEGLRWRALCLGYLPVEGSIAEASTDSRAILVELERGFEWRLTVCDAHSGNGLAGAEVLDPSGRRMAATDARGEVHVRAPTWPSKLRVQREGYFDRLLDPQDLELVGGVIPLMPREKR